MQKQKTIFITVNRGLIIRNILRTPAFKKFTSNKNLKFILLIPNVRNIDPPDYLFQELESDNIKIEVVENRTLGKLEGIFNHLIVSKLIFSKSTKIAILFHGQETKRKSRAHYFFSWLFFAPLSKINFLKKVSRKIDTTFFQSRYTEYFDKYQPDLVFSTSIINHFDVDFLKEAKKRKIKTIAMPRSWDNLDKYLFRATPDLLLVQNEVMKKEAQKYQDISSKKIKVVGFPQFDIYSDKSIILSKEDYCQLKDFDPKLPVLFLGSEGIWTKGDEKIFKKIILARGKEIPQCNVLVRPHFSEVNGHNYGALADYGNVYIDDKFRKSDFFVDNWDIDMEDMVDFTNSLFHSNMMITFASTLTLDAACFDKPIIAIKYGVLFVNGRDESGRMYETCHYDWVLKTKGISLVNEEQELMEKINQYLLDPNIQSEGRKLLREKLCFKVDGLSSQRIVEAIYEALSE